MGAVAAGAMIVGTAVQAYGAIKSAQDEAALERDKKAMAYIQANELEQREAANDAVRRNRMFSSQLDYSAAYAGSGKAGGGLGTQLELKRQTDQAIMMADRDTEFQAAMLRHGGDINGNLADATEASGYLNAIGTVLSKAGSAYSMYNQSGASNQTPESLPPLPSNGGGGGGGGSRQYYTTG